MNVREMVARLNAKTARFDIGRGGVPDLTDQDIAAALGMAGDEFQRQCFCAVYWPDGAALEWQKLNRQLASRQFGEWRSRMDRVVTAQIAICQADMLSGEEGRRARSHARLMLDGARAAMWPELNEERYRALRIAVFAELRNPRKCVGCNGRGSAQVDGKVIACTRCEGSGEMRVSDTWRASAIGVHRQNFKPAWSSVYQWTFAIVNDAVQACAVGLSAALSDAA